MPFCVRRATQHCSGPHVVCLKGIYFGADSEGQKGGEVVDFARTSLSLVANLSRETKSAFHECRVAEILIVGMTESLSLSGLTVLDALAANESCDARTGMELWCIELEAGVVLTEWLMYWMRNFRIHSQRINGHVILEGRYAAL